MSRNKYEYGRPVKADKTAYGFSNNSYDGGNEEDAAGDFWKDMKSEDEVVENEKTSKKCTQSIRGCWRPIIDFYRPKLNDSAAVSTPSSDFEFSTADLDFTTSSNAEREIRKLYYQLRLGASVLVAVSFFFWAWAVRNTESMESGQDLGMYSFLTTLVSSHYVLWRTQRGPSAGIMVATPLTRVLVTASHVMVCLNYCLGVLYSYTVGSNVYYLFGGYCLIFSGLWGYTAFKGFVLLSNLQINEVDIAARSDDGEEDAFEVGDYF